MLTADWLTDWGARMRAATERAIRTSGRSGHLVRLLAAVDAAT